MRTSRNIITEIAYTAEQEALAQLGDTPGAPWEELDGASRDAQHARVNTIVFDTPVPASPIDGTVGGDTAAQAAAVFTAVVNCLR